MPAGVLGFPLKAKTFGVEAAENGVGFSLLIVVSTSDCGLAAANRTWGAAGGVGAWPRGALGTELRVTSESDR